MEHLMTYGWAILIISVVLAALFQLGVFSGVASPMARPGLCQVIRPYDTEAQRTSVAGMCSGQLPQYVASFNGQSSYIDSGSSTALAPNMLTITAWVNSGDVNYQQDGSSGQSIIAESPDPANYIYWVRIQAGNLLVSMYGGEVSAGGAIPNSNIWYFVAVTASNGGVINAYVNGNNVASGAAGTSYASYNTVIGDSRLGRGIRFFGSVANVRIYNTTLSAAEIRGLYAEGIGGAL